MSVASLDKPLTSLISPASSGVEVEQVIKLANAELQELLAQRASVVRRIVVLRRTIAGLLEMFGDDVLPTETRSLVELPVRKPRGTGLTDACRAALNRSSQPVTAREVVDKIRASNTGLIEGHKDPVASVTSILERLSSYGEATAVRSQSGRRVWASVGT